MSPDGSQKGTKTVPYARSQSHLNDLVEKVCDSMEDYAQARWKKSKKPTLIRMVGPDGNMNPNFSKVDVMQDEDLNSQLKFQVSSTCPLGLNYFESSMSGIIFEHYVTQLLTSGDATRRYSNKIRMNLRNGKMLTVINYSFSVRDHCGGQRGCFHRRSFQRKPQPCGRDMRGPDKPL